MLTVQEINPTEFMSFEQHCPTGNFYQTIWQQRLLLREHNLTTFRGLYEDNELVMAALLVGRKIHFGYRFEVYGGPVIAPNKVSVARLRVFLADLEQYAFQHQGLELKLVPNLDCHVLDNDGTIIDSQNETLTQAFSEIGYHYADFKSVGYKTAAHANHYVYKKDLSHLNTDTLTKSYSPKARYNLNKAKEFGVTLREIPFDELSEFKYNTNKTAERLHFKDKSLAYYQDAFETYGNQVQFVVAELNLNNYIAIYQKKITHNDAQINELTAKHKGYNEAKIADLKRQLNNHTRKIAQAKMFADEYGTTLNIAGAMFIIQPQEMDYVFSYTNEEFKMFRGPFLIQDAMMHEALRQHIQTYNFLGIAGEFDGSDGVFEFKKGFNGYPAEEIGEFTKILRPAKHQIISTLKGLKQLVS
ncbi:aminoacyltransferase [Furfurilactobacillus rossiae]|uniref:peptidoglycan bridge formation glycyltransferase FemA/FemB family protein n=1 Tax=Furfurilactobacillus rossiae TaxID=231049 RepID=UPI001F40679A|nr:peptidoglycan bridge formation glycyltransferase FemA/FemB family protein [Furfurilactobacillus rossiae]MCF6165059.1 aminoacyltransferase [Furfurilactobacillus rossiae]